MSNVSPRRRPIVSVHKTQVVVDAVHVDDVGVAVIVDNVVGGVIVVVDVAVMTWLLR